MKILLISAAALLLSTAAFATSKEQLALVANARSTLSPAEFDKFIVGIEIDYSAACVTAPDTPEIAKLTGSSSVQKLCDFFAIRYGEALKTREDPDEAVARMGRLLTQMQNDILACRANPVCANRK